MPLDIVVGAQYGDEGKGKITDTLAEDASAIVRFQGGNNAGHTLVVEGVTYKLHLIPSGIIRKGMWCLLGNGVVLDPRVFRKELEGLHAQNISTDYLRISWNAHLIMPYHVQLDHIEEEGRSSKDSIGTTRRGIGPCYSDKTARTGIRIQDLFDLDRFAKRVGTALDHHRPRLKEATPSVEEVVEEYRDHREMLLPYVEDISPRIWKLLSEDKLVIGEGAQGALLDLDHGMYPFVTSSNCLPATAALGCGVPPQAIRKIWAVCKAYPTRIDTVGPFPSAMPMGEGIEQVLIDRGGEFGTTTGRRRRAGWMDAVALRYAVQVAGITDLVITKIDVMGDLPLEITTQYSIDGEVTDQYPTRLDHLYKALPINEEHPSFSGDLTKARSWEELPKNARGYLERISSLAGVPLRMVGVGQSRDQIIPVGRNND